MRVSVYVALVLASLLAAFSPRLASRQSPRLAARLVTGSALAAAGATWWALALLLGSLVGGEPRVGTHTGWTTRSWWAIDPVPHPIALVAAAALTIVTLRAAVELYRRGAALRRARAGCGSATVELVIVDVDQVYAYAVPGPSPHIVTTTALLTLLDPPQRRAMFAHERSHLRHRHDLYLLAGRVSSAVNPLLTRHRDDIAYLCERWADEDAADELGDRAVVASALAQASAAALETRGLLAFERLGVRHRLTALATQCPPLRPMSAVSYLAFALLPVLVVSDATFALFRLIEAVRR